jgi:hypothetical protein
MLSSVPWSHFIVAAIGIACCYYLWLLYSRLKDKFNRPGGTDPAGNSEARRFWRMEERPAREHESTNSDADGSDDEPMGASEEVEEEKSFQELTRLAGDIEALLNKASKTPSRNDIMSSLRGMLQQHPNLNRNPYRVAIFNMIRKRAQEQCSLTITEEELEAAWPGRLD